MNRRAEEHFRFFYSVKSIKNFRVYFEYHSEKRGLATNFPETISNTFSCVHIDFPSN